MPSLPTMDEAESNAWLARVGSEPMARMGAPFACDFRQSPITLEPDYLMQLARIRIEPALVTVTLYRAFLTHGHVGGKIGRLMVQLALVGVTAPSRAGADLDIVFELGDITHGDRMGHSGASERNLLTPDTPFLRSGGYLPFRQRVHRNYIEFKDRRDMVVWRGATSGGETVPGQRPRPFSWLQRLDVCHVLSRGPNAASCDVGVSDTHHTPRPERLEQIEKAGLLKPWMDQIGFMNFKLALDIDGFSNGYQGLFRNFLMGCCVLKVGSPSGFRQWYYGRMSAWEHYVPIASDLGDLDEIVARCLDGSIDVEGIARRGSEFGWSLTYEEELARFETRMERLMNGDNDLKRLYAAHAREMFG